MESKNALPFGLQQYNIISKDQKKDDILFSQINCEKLQDD